MNQFDDEFLDHIKSVLRGHEEPYDQGAWERFASKAKPAQTTPRRKPISMWKWVAAAAAVVVGIVLFAKIFSSTNSVGDAGQPIIADKQTPAAEQPATIQAPAEERALAGAVIPPQTPESLTGTVNGAGIDDNNPTLLQSFYVHPDRITRPQSETPDLTSSQRPADLLNPLPPVAKQPGPVEVATQNVDFWKNKVVENKPGTTQPTKEAPRVTMVATAGTEQKKNGHHTPKRWQSSLYVSPVFGDLGINMGYGYSLGYAINDKIKISSGIAHTKISSSRSFDPAPQPAAVATLASSKNSLKTTSFAPNAVTAPQQTTSIQQVEGILSGIDVPVELNYSFSKKFYAAAGVSGLIVINDRKTYTLLDSRDVKVSVETNKGNIKEDKNVTFSKYSTSSDPEVVPNESVPFLGFYNVSVGFRQKISDKNAVSLEPFVKVPMKNVTQQHLNYSGVGVRLKFDF